MKTPKFVPEKVTHLVAKQVAKIEANSPHILFGVGVAGVLAGTVLACRATLKAEPIVDTMRDNVADIKRDLHDTPEYKRDLAYVYIRGTKDLAAIYALPVGVMAASLGLLAGSHIQLSKRNTALTAAYASLHQAYEAYRQRVRDEIGEDREVQLYHAMEERENSEGKKVTVVNPLNVSPYAKFFDELSTAWTHDPETNRAFLMAQQNYYNDILQVRGHVFLNEVYDALGVSRTNAGQHVGWRVDGAGDKYIDFGLYEVRNSRFIDSTEHSLLLDFNVDGVIEIYPPHNRVVEI